MLKMKKDANCKRPECVHKLELGAQARTSEGAMDVLIDFLLENGIIYVMGAKVLREDNEKLARLWIADHVPELRVGDMVWSKRCNEHWTVGAIETDFIIPCGWPLSWEPKDSCVFEKAATDDEHWKLLEELARMNDQKDPRCRSAIVEIMKRQSSSVPIAMLDAIETERMRRGP